MADEKPSPTLDPTFLVGLTPAQKAQVKLSEQRAAKLGQTKVEKGLGTASPYKKTA